MATVAVPLLPPSQATVPVPHRPRTSRRAPGAERWPQGHSSGHGGPGPPQETWPRARARGPFLEGLRAVAEPAPALGPRPAPPAPPQHPRVPCRAVPASPRGQCSWPPPREPLGHLQLGARSHNPAPVGAPQSHRTLASFGVRMGPGSSWFCRPPPTFADAGRTLPCPSPLQPGDGVVKPPEQSPSTGSSLGMGSPAQEGAGTKGWRTQAGAAAPRELSPVIWRANKAPGTCRPDPMAGIFTE